MKKYKDFTLMSSRDQEITLSEVLKESKVWLLFYRGAF